MKVTSAQLEIIKWVKDNPNKNITAIAEALGRQRPNVSEDVSKLAEQKILHITEVGPEKLVRLDERVELRGDEVIVPPDLTAPFYDTLSDALLRYLEPREKQNLDAIMAMARRTPGIDRDGWQTYEILRLHQVDPTRIEAICRYIYGPQWQKGGSPFTAGMSGPVQPIQPQPLVQTPQQPGVYIWENPYTKQPYIINVGGERGTGETRTIVTPSGERVIESRLEFEEIEEPIVDKEGKPLVDKEGKPLTRKIKRPAILGLQQQQQPLTVGDVFDKVIKPTIELMRETEKGKETESKLDESRIKQISKESTKDLEKQVSQLSESLHKLSDQLMVERAVKQATGNS